jgi:hypothetical protein
MFERAERTSSIRRTGNKATDTNIVAFGLSTKRSSVYTLIQNRFMGKYCQIDYCNDLSL